MSLFNSIQLANNALFASQIGLQVTGNNIANANTPDYIRQDVVLSPAPTQRVGDLLLGLGVEVSGVIQKVDQFLEQRLRDARSDLTESETRQDIYLKLEAIVNELSDTDLSTSLTNFFNSIHDVLNQPESTAIRNLAVLQGEALAQDIRRLDARVLKLHSDVNDRIGGVAGEINSLLKEIARLNVQIVTVEGGGTTFSDAVGLRDERYAALTKLAKLTDIRAIEQPTGSTSVYSGGDILVFEGTFREVTAARGGDSGLTTLEIRLADTDSPISTATGELAGLLAARDEILGGFLTQFDELARTLAYEFNRLHAGGQGLTGFTQLTSEFNVSDAAAPLDQAGLPYAPDNGFFQVLVRNRQTGVTTTTDIRVDLSGLDTDTSLSDLAAALDAVSGISAAITPQRGLSIASDSSSVEFSFAEDGSGVLAALGLNTFFSGRGASDLAVNGILKSDPGKLAASSGGIGADSRNAERLASLLDEPLDSQGGASISVLYDQLTGGLAQGAAVARSVTEGLRVFEQTLQSQQLGISGVSIDEEVVNMIQYQRAFQASARFISTISDLLEVLVNL